jgi:hypothetical protein
MAGHSAAASTAGYLYQTNWALVDLLRKGQHRPDQATHARARGAQNFLDLVSNTSELAAVMCLTRVGAFTRSG